MITIACYFSAMSLTSIDAFLLWCWIVHGIAFIAANIPLIVMLTSCSCCSYAALSFFFSLSCFCFSILSTRWCNFFSFFSSCSLLYIFVAVPLWSPSFAEFLLLFLWPFIDFFLTSIYPLFQSFEFVFFLIIFSIFICFVIGFILGIGLDLFVLFIIYIVCGRVSLGLRKENLSNVY